MKKITLVIILCCLIIGSCQNGDDNLGKQEEPRAENINLFTNPTNPTFMRVENDTAVISYIGIKDDNGIPNTLRNVVYKDKLTGDNFFFEYDDQSRPIRTWNSIGEIMEFIYDDNQLARVLATATDGTTVNIPIGPDDGTSSKTNVNYLFEKRKGKMRVSTTPARNYANNTVSSEKNTQNLTLNLNRCGFPFESPYVSILIKGNEELLNSFVPATNLGGGKYQIKIPEPSSISNPDITEYCEGFTFAVETACAAVSAFTFGGAIDPVVPCATIATAIEALTTVIPGDGPIVFASCERSLRVLTNVCRFVTLGAGGNVVFDDPNQPAIGISQVCGISDLFDDISNSFEITPQVTVPGLGVQRFDAIQINATGPFENLDLNIEGVELVNQFSTTPSDPNPMQGYIANAIIDCGSPGSFATISIVGTDGFTDSRTITLTAPSNAISISIPGAEQGVSDVITVTLENGTERSISIIF